EAFVECPIEQERFNAFAGCAIAAQFTKSMIEERSRHEAACATVDGGRQDRHAIARLFRQGRLRMDLGFGASAALPGVRNYRDRDTELLRRLLAQSGLARRWWLR